MSNTAQRVGKLEARTALAVMLLKSHSLITSMKRAHSEHDKAIKEAGKGQEGLLAELEQDDAAHLLAMKQAATVTATGEPPGQQGFGTRLWTRSLNRSPRLRIRW